MSPHLLQVFDVRAMLEAYACELAAMHRTDAELGALQQEADLFTRLVAPADGQEPELMLKCARHLCTSLDEVVALLAPKSGLEGARSCRGCKHSGFDIADGPYCTQASVAEGFPAGILLHSSRVGERCPGPSHPHWEPRPT